MSNSSNGAGGGIGLIGILGVVFVVLKLCGVIKWSWWWVTCPFWAAFAILAVVLVVVGVLKLCVYIGEKAKK